MREQQARITANLVMAAAAAGAVYYVLRTPPLRRAAWQFAKRWAAGPLAVWAVTEVRRAWDASAQSGTAQLELRAMGNRPRSAAL